ncbi:MAG: FAD binding domain-containing protein [Lachnospiraceae bacterium]|nr:FAD binding domain-containing protein [Lachnospiraceae bacterium]
MLKFREYVRAESLEDAYVRNQKKSAHILGGMLWLKMQNRTVQTVIDLSDLGLSGIEETEEEYRIGAMTSLRELELHKGLDAMTGGAVRESLRHIVGVQFRNLATVGGSIFGRFGFSDVLTMFLALDSWVELYHGGLVPMERFAAEGAENDILVRVIVKKEKRRYAYLSHRNTKTDFPVMACAVAVGEGWRSGEGERAAGRAVFGATPARARSYELPAEWLERFQAFGEEERKALAVELASVVPTGSNIRAGKEFRSHLAGILLYRGLMEALYGGSGQAAGAGAPACLTEEKEGQRA